MSSGVGRGFTSTQVAASAQRDDNLQPVTDTIILSGGSEDDSYHVEPSLQAIQRPPGHMEAGKACASCKQRSNCDQLNVCGSCNEPVHLYCTASLLWPLSQYCYFCQPCKEEPHLRGAVFEALSFHGKAGATVRQIEEFVQERQDICLEERASKSYEKKTYEKLRGSHESVRSLLTRMAHSNQGKNIGFQVEVAPQSRSTRTSEKYRLKLENQADWDLLPEAGCVEETGFCMQEWMQRVAESGQDTSATNNANRRLFRELDDRRSSAQLGAKNKRTFTASASSDVSNKSSVHKAPSNEAMRRQIEELEADRLTKSDGGVLIQPVVKKAKNADLQGQAAQKAGSKRDRLQLSASEGASPEQILQSVKASLSALKTWKPDDAKNPEDVTVNNNPKVARVQQLLTKLKPKLEGDFGGWFAAVGQLQQPIKEIQITDGEVLAARVQMQAAMCAHQDKHQSKLQQLVAQAEELCQSMQQCLHESDEDAENLREKIILVRQLEGQQQVYKEAQHMIRSSGPSK